MTMTDRETNYLTVLIALVGMALVVYCKDNQTLVSFFSATVVGGALGSFFTRIKSEHIKDSVKTEDKPNV